MFLLAYNQYFSSGLSFNLNRIFTKNIIVSLIIHMMFVLMISFSQDIIKWGQQIKGERK